MGNDIAIRHEFLVTGIKVIDLFCPIPKGGVSNLLGGVYKTGLILDLIYRQREFVKGHSIWVGLKNESIEQYLGSEKKLDALTVFEVVKEDAGQIESRVSEAMREADRRRGEGEDVLVFLDFPRKMSAAVEDSVKACIKVDQNGSISVIQCVFGIDGDPGDPTSESLPDLSNDRITLTHEMAAESCYPPVDPLLSQSGMLKAERVGEKHFNTAVAAKTLLSNYKELQDIVANLGMEELSPEIHVLGKKQSN